MKASLEIFALFISVWSKKTLFHPVPWLPASNPRGSPKPLRCVESVPLAEIACGLMFAQGAGSMNRPSCESGGRGLSPHRTGALCQSQAQHMGAVQEMWVERLTLKSHRWKRTNIKVSTSVGFHRGRLLHKQPHVALWRSPILSRPSLSPGCQQQPTRVWSNCPASSMYE